MKIFVISDTHGRIKKAVEVYKGLTDVDLMIHLGDYKKDARDLESRLGIETVFVEGNMDGSMTQESSSKIIDTEYGKILITHGHLDNVKNGFESIASRCISEGCKAVLFGHTHRPLYEEKNGIYLLNPGSISVPRDGSYGSYAIIHTSDDEFRASIVYCDKKNSPLGGKRPGGYLKRLLNYSDRF